MGSLTSFSHRHISIFIGLSEHLNASIMVMIFCCLRCIERSRRKCIQYWPEKQQTEEFAMVLVTHQETLEFEDHVERLFQIKHKMVRYH